MEENQLQFIKYCTQREDLKLLNNSYFLKKVSSPKFKIVFYVLRHQLHNLNLLSKKYDVGHTKILRLILDSINWNDLDSLIKKEAEQKK